ncbi:hypothetical protein BLNAU_23623 [Blattamonas nauphoetae]|uniref:Uncharacterized protein n=1 Tax=Blattamonas nauphoetae TaxID=2049346 RepID=A0ABQ9WPR3_9EUKA|nr:hypothetical protein BLNAU_23623 [Blattamonas nauphoetae]
MRNEVFWVFRLSEVFEDRETTWERESDWHINDELHGWQSVFASARPFCSFESRLPDTLCDFFVSFSLVDLSEHEWLIVREQRGRATKESGRGGKACERSTLSHHTPQKRQCAEKGKSIQSTTSGPHEDVTALTRHAKRSEAGVDHDGTWLATVVIQPNCRTFSPTEWLNTIVFCTIPPSYLLSDP